MLLTVDLGNTSVKLGIFEEGKQIAFTCSDGISDNYRSLFLSFIYKSNVREDDIDAAILSCVVPSVYDTVYDTLVELVGNNIIDINPNKDYGIKLDVPNPEEVGDDIIVMCAYAYNLYHRELLLVSMGTCSVICHVTKQGEFKHCIIAPGFTKMSETLWKNAAQLPEFELSHKDTFLANTTIDAMKVGVYNGYVGMMSSLIKGLKKELEEEPYVIGCGGLGKMAVPYMTDLDEYDPDFVTKGLNFIYERYGKNE